LAQAQATAQKAIVRSMLAASRYTMACRRSLCAWYARAILLGACASAGIADVPEAFSTKLRCPFAKVWLKHGPHRAAEMLGLGVPHSYGTGRRLDETIWGTCTYTNPFAGGDTCMELHGASWTDDTAAERCANAMGSVAGTLAKDGRCTISSETAGWCSTAGGSEMTHTVLSNSASTCEAAASACVTWSQGIFVVAGQCAEEDDRQGNISDAVQSDDWSGFSGGETPACSIAPGPIGAAHQLAQSPGYSINCNNTPAQQSPYMWPLRWTANVEAKSLGYQTDEVQYESRGRVWYMLDKNWKRFDTWYERGVQRAIGQSPCEKDNVDTSSTAALACNRSGSANSTMLHRGSKMVFIDWAQDGTISNCTWLDMGPIGNIRPDWFMDNRGASTSVQYLGNSHVYYLGEPRLVKQWRKKDFANQYFTMSMQANPGPDGTHWPLILNVPGEGFGDDFLQHYYGHRHLEESEADAFLLDEIFVASGGSCPQSASSGTDGPPTGQAEHVPSNLEVEEVSWREIVYTASPVWTPPEVEPSSMETGSQRGSVEVTAGVHVDTCWDAQVGSVRIAMRLSLATPAWAAIAFRETEECLMTPRGGGDGEVVFAQPDNDGNYAMSFGALPPSLKVFNADATSEFEDGLTPIVDAEGFDNSLASYSNGHLVIGFARSYDTKPSALHLTMASGIDAKVSYHSTRECFEVTDIPECSASACLACPACDASLASEQDAD